MKKKDAAQKTQSKYSSYRTGEGISEKPQHLLKTAKRLLLLLKGSEGKIVFVVATGIINAALTIIGPQYLGSVIDLISAQVKNKLSGTGIDYTEITRILLTILLIYAGASLCSFLVHFVMAGVTQGLVTDLREKINRKLSVLPLAYFDSHNRGDILSRVTNDIDNINVTFENAFIQTVNCVVTFFGALIIMIRYNIIMTVASLAPLPAAAIIALLILNSSKKYFRRQWETTGDINGHIEEMFTGHNEVKAFGYEKKAIKEFDEINDRLYNVGLRAQFLSGMLGPILNFTNNLGYVFICVIGGYLILNKGAGIGAITVFMLYSKIFLQPIIDMSNIINQMQSSLASAERVFEIVDEKEEIPDNAATEIKDVKGYVSIKSVNFSYDESKPLIENFNLEVEPGQLVAIVGPTGAGKTTIVNLLMRFYEIQSGIIMIDGTDIRGISRENLRSIFGMVLQDTWLFKGTVKENIMYGHEEKSEIEFAQAVKAAKVDSFAMTLENGYDTEIDDEGGNLSQGQKQLITIARAILSDPPILILDEATSSVDTRTEKQIQSAMHSLMSGRTNFVIAHRLSTIMDADKIIFIKNGKITEQGTHDSLLKLGGDYAELFYSQFSMKQAQAK